MRRVRKSKKLLEIMTDSTAAPTAVKTNCFRFLHLLTHLRAHATVAHRRPLLCVSIFLLLMPLVHLSFTINAVVIRATSKIIDFMLFDSFKFDVRYSSSFSADQEREIERKGVRGNKE